MLKQNCLSLQEVGLQMTMTTPVKVSVVLFVTMFYLPGLNTEGTQNKIEEALE